MQPSHIKGSQLCVFRAVSSYVLVHTLCRANCNVLLNLPDDVKSTLLALLLLSSEILGNPHPSNPSKNLPLQPTTPAASL